MADYAKLVGMIRFLVLLWCTGLYAAAPTFFVQMSDPQMGMFAKNANMAQEEANLSFAVANINRLHPAFVVVTGDLVNKGGDAAQISRYHDLIGMVDASIPVYNVPGNHDVGNQPTPDTLAQYRKAFGKDYYTFDAGDIRGIVLNSNLIKAPENAPEQAAAQEKWLLATLQQARQDNVPHVFVFQHIAYFVNDPNEPDNYNNIPGVTRHKYLNWLHEYGVTRVYAGHLHHNALGRDGDLEIISTAATGMPIGHDPSGFRVIRIADGQMENYYYQFGTIPNVIKPDAPLPTFPKR